MARKPYKSLDRMWAKRKLMLACLAVCAATQVHLVVDALDDVSDLGNDDLLDAIFWNKHSLLMTRQQQSARRSALRRRDRK